MKKLLVLLSLCVLVAGQALGQSVSCEVVLDRDQYIASEELVVKVRITNFSGQTLTLGKDDRWLSLQVESGPQRSIPQRAPWQPLGEFTVESSKVATCRINIAPSFDLTRPGRYTVAARVNLPQLNQMIASKAKPFHIINGNVIWEQDFGTPANVQGGNTSPELRKFALLQTTQDRDVKLYFRLTDAPATQTYSIFPIGNMVSVSKPEAQLDRFNNLHVLYQAGARSFLYTMVNPDGVMIARETHDISGSRPVLRPGNDGRINVAGGARRFAANDLPPSPGFSSEADIPTSQP